MIEETNTLILKELQNISRLLQLAEWRASGYPVSHAGPSTYGPGYSAAGIGGGMLGSGVSGPPMKTEERKFDFGQTVIIKKYGIIGKICGVGGSAGNAYGGIKPLHWYSVKTEGGDEISVTSDGLDLVNLDNAPDLSSPEWVDKFGKTPWKTIW